MDVFCPSRPATDRQERRTCLYAQETSLGIVVRVMPQGLGTRPIAVLRQDMCVLFLCFDLPVALIWGTSQFILQSLPIAFEQ